MKYGLIGEHLGHSFSKEIHESILPNDDYSYDLLELSKEELGAFLQAKDFLGLNVTIPYKEAVLPYLDVVSEEAKKIGAVNTIVNRGGKLYGYNTDYFGLCSLIKKNKIFVGGKKVLVLGTGGTSKTACAVLRDFGAKEVLVVSRNATQEAISYEEAQTLHTDAQVIVNATPVGMYPNTNKKPIDVSLFHALEGVVDAIYHPLCTQLVLEARQKGLPAVGGLYMLVVQAIKSYELFRNCSVEKDRVGVIYRNLLKEKKNIVFIGMPSSGKTSAGKKVASRLGRPFYDSDGEIQARTGKTPAQIIEEDGIDAFRDYESQVIFDLSQKSGVVIATGGGAVLREENVRALKQNGVLYFINRNLKTLRPTSDRPLTSDREKLEKTYRERLPIYRSVADFTFNIYQNPLPMIADIVNYYQKEKNDETVSPKRSQY